MGVMTPVTSAAASKTGAVGKLLRYWRDTRGVSQLNLAMHAGFSAQELRIESFFPADAASEREWARLAGTAPAT